MSTVEKRHYTPEEQKQAGSRPSIHSKIPMLSCVKTQPTFLVK